ncbi:MAG: PEP/pyruvate-binding domain-containing protein [Candidatus Omnitrophica bacterium]|nr:PEP/pyruvate-binding domain-containing protein [Candidatus Omnitrophota bacterium]
MASTGIAGLDRMVTGLQMGDNVVWQIDDIKDYLDFVKPFIKNAIRENRKIVYIRFANHKPLLEAQKNVTVYKLNAYAGFESFSTQINNILTQQGEGVYYVFDCLSDLLSAWSNDLMIGNFFKITCPYLYELNTITYFSILRNRHSYRTIARIRDTTQLLIDVYSHEGKYYVHPLKVWNRYSPTMFLPHIKSADKFVPIATSVDTARLFSEIFKEGTKSTERNLDYWDRLFMKAEYLIKSGAPQKEKSAMLDQACRIMIAREEKLIALAKANLSLKDLVNIKSRMIGTGFIGGKSVGMLIARNILSNDKTLDVDRYFEPHDSFYIGSDVFYSYIVENGWWKLRMQQRTKKGYFEVADVLREKMLAGVFPEEIKEQFRQMLEYFGQSPIIVRSSSLLEDSFGNTFAGKYESIFCVNQGSPEQRYAKFTEAVRRIYASTMNKDALTYRLHRGLAYSDEQMALLVQRVSGAYKKQYFFPDMAGVGISYNTFVWKSEMDPKAGMLRLVVGLGTRAVNRVEGDYPRIAALDEPLLKPHASLKDTRRFSQHDVDLLNTETNKFETLSLNKLVKEKISLPLELVAIKDDEIAREMRESGRGEYESWIVTFDRLLSETPFTGIMQNIMKTLEKNYRYPVDIEFTVNFKKGGEFKINLLQCRPLQTKGLGKRVPMPKNVEKESVLVQSTGSFLGGNISQSIKRIIYVDPKAYNLLPEPGKYNIARAIGELNTRMESREDMPVLLLGPGRWGTSTPSLGVPVSFSEINNIAVLGEMAFATANAMPELSFGTHFFQDLVESGIFYFALFTNRKEHFLNKTLLGSMPNIFSRLMPVYAKYENVIKVYEPSDKARLVADIISQKLLVFYE